MRLLSGHGDTGTRNRWEPSDGEAWAGHMHGEAATTNSLPAAPNVAGSLAELDSTVDILNTY